VAKAKRPVFIPDPDHGLVREELVEFEWFSGFSHTQKARSIDSMHKAASEIFVNSSFLEISSKSSEEIGAKLSAFNLYIPCDESDRPLLLEAAFQGSKVFKSGKQHKNLYTFNSGKDVKRFMKEQPKEELTEFKFEGKSWQLTPLSAFYDWLYLRGLSHLEVDDPHSLDSLSSYTGFTDIEFNPQRSINCQARSCALYVALLRAELFRDAISHPDAFIEILKQRDYGMPPENSQQLTFGK